MSLARALALALSTLVLAVSCASHGATDGKWRADDVTLALAHEHASSMRGHGLAGGILVGIAERARLEIHGTDASISFTGERAPDGADYAVVESAPGTLQLTVKGEHRELPNKMTLRCVPRKHGMHVGVSGRVRRHGPPEAASINLLSAE